jgi:glutathionylspermidine synthase
MHRCSAHGRLGTMWVVGDAAGIVVREADGPVIADCSRFVAHFLT